MSSLVFPPLMMLLVGLSLGFQFGGICKDPACREWVRDTIAIFEIALIVAQVAIWVRNLFL